jgi:hypothetical protein
MEGTYQDPGGLVHLVRYDEQITVCGSKYAGTKVKYESGIVHQHRVTCPECRKTAPPIGIQAEDDPVYIALFWLGLVAAWAAAFGLIYLVTR